MQFIKQKRVKNKSGLNFKFIFIAFLFTFGYNKIMKKYYYFNVKKALSVQNLVTIEYLNLKEGFFYPEEVHNFCEFIYLFSGNVLCEINGEKINLSPNGFYLIKPNNKHSYKVLDGGNATIMIVCFKCAFELIDILEGKHKLSHQNKTLILNILEEAKKAFCFPFEKKLVLLSSPEFGAQQLVENYIEELLLSIVRTKLKSKTDIRLVQSSEELAKKLVDDIKEILEENVYEPLTLTDISKMTHYSKTFLNNVFKKNTGKTIMAYFMELKIEKSKQLIQENKSIIDLSFELNFESPNYFSKAFKKHTGLSPTQYKKSLQAKKA